nr:general secretion pathway protein GspK [Hyphomicrobiales bacterium]
LLANLFRAANVPTAKARQIADAMLDWRDTDSLRRLNGAEEQDYRRAGLSYRPRNRPFPVVEEMKLVLGMTPQIFAKVEAGLTVYSGKSRVDVRIASPLVKQALRGGNAAPSAANSSLGPSPETEPITQSRSGNAYRIHVEFVWKSVPVIREAVIRFRSDRSDPYWLIRWQ